jgi:hypothetical protein
MATFTAKIHEVETVHIAFDDDDDDDDNIVIYNYE